MKRFTDAEMYIKITSLTIARLNLTLTFTCSYQKYNQNCEIEGQNGQNSDFRLKTPLQKPLYCHLFYFWLIKGTFMIMCLEMKK